MRATAQFAYVSAIRCALLGSLAAWMSLLPVSQVHATGLISCQAADGSGATVDLGLSAGPKTNPLTVRISARGQTWSTMAGEADTDIVIFQAFDDGDVLRVDLTDPNVLGIVAELRLVRAEEMKSLSQGGTLRLLGVGTHLLTCEGP